jgi:dihydrofolate reductase
VITLIWAQDAGGDIGKDGTLPWYLPEDMARFRELTMGASVVMGRVTWDSLPERFRPLPGRRNLVLTRSPEWAAEGAERVASLEAAAALAGENLWVIGGGQVYSAAMPHADRLIVTELAAAFDCDTAAPQLDGSWTVADREPQQGWSTSSTGLRYRVTTYAR